MNEQERTIAFAAVAEIVTQARAPEAPLGARPSKEALERIAVDAANAMAAGFNVLKRASERS